MKKAFKYFALIAACTVVFTAAACSRPQEQDDKWYDKNASAELEYELSADKTYYTLNGIGACMDKNIVIPATLNGKPVKVIAKEAFKDCEEIETVSIPGSIVRINESAFENCKNLSEVVLANGITIIPSECFSGCSKLTKITIPASVKKINHSAFSYTGFETFVMPDTVESIEGSLFFGCTALKSVKLSFKLSKLTQSLFYKCVSLTEITVPETVTAIENNAFSYSGLTTVTLPDSVEEVGESVFSQCNNLENVTLSKNITAIAYEMFAECTKLKSVSIPSKVTTIGRFAFSNAGVTEIFLPDSVTFFDRYAFTNCKSLTKINIPKNIDIIECAFNYCENLQSVTFADKSGWSVWIDDIKIDEFTEEDLSTAENAANLLKEYNDNTWKHS